MRIFFKSMFLVLFLSTHFSCGNSGSGNKETAANYSLTGSMKVSESPTLVASEKVVTFTITWSEGEEGKFTGLYTDDYFSPEPAALEGRRLSNGEREFEITLPALAYGVMTIGIKMPAITEESIAKGEILLSSVVAKNGEGTVVFSKEDVIVKPVDGSALPPIPQLGTGSESGVEFFAQVKGSYQFYAKNVEPTTEEKYNDDTFKHGALYKVTISDQTVEEGEGADGADWGSITIEGEGQKRSFNFGGQRTLFQKVDHEQYSRMMGTSFDITLQHVFAGDIKFITYAPHSDKAFWIFEVDEPEPMVAPLTGLAKYGIEFIVGTYNFKIGIGGNCKLYDTGDEFSITINSDGAITSAGKFQKYTKNDLSINSHSSTIMWCKGGQTTNPSCNLNSERDKPTFYIRGEQLQVAGGSYQILSGDNAQTCYFDVIDE